MYYKVTIEHNDDTHEIYHTDDLDCYELVRGLEKCKYRRFSVSLSPFT